MDGRILVLDDEEHYAEMLQELLRGSNYRVDMATRPEFAISQLEEVSYDLVISDYKMPVMDGADFLKRARELYPNLPFILVSGLMNTPELVKVANMSVTLVLEKPLNTEIFLKHVSRFAAPMTDEEKEALSSQEDAEESVGGSEAASSYTQEPRYFSAGSASSKRFMQNAWGLCRGGAHLFILDPNGGEAELVVKDLSYWRGEGEKAIESLGLSELIEGGVDRLKSILADTASSQVVSVQVPSFEDLSVAAKFAETTLSQVEGLLLVFHCAAAGSHAQFSALSGEYGLILPSFAQRPIDIAQYVYRCALIESGRQGKPNAAELSTEVIYQVLTCEWASYEQLKDVITQAVSEAGEEAPIKSATVSGLLGLVPKQITAPDRRLAQLLQLSQGKYLRDLLVSSGDSAPELAKKLELDSSIRTEEALQNMSLIKAELAAL